MTYELIGESNRGVLIERTPIMSDTRDTFTVSFVLPDHSSYVAIFTGADAAEYRKIIKDSRCRIPKELLSKEQYVSLTVSAVGNDAITRSWECEPLKITSMLCLRKTQWEVSGGMTEESAYKRLEELERYYASAIANDETVRLRAQIDVNARNIETLKNELQKTNESVVTLTEKVNQIIADYDPLKH